MNFDEELGQRIRDLRQSQGHTQQALADNLGFSRGSVSNIEAGRQAVSAEILWKLANFLGISINSFFEATSDNAMKIAELRSRIATAQFHMDKVVEVLKSD